MPKNYYDREGGHTERVFDVSTLCGVLQLGYVIDCTAYCQNNSAFIVFSFPMYLLIDLFVPLVNLVQVRAVQQSFLLQNTGVSIQTQLLQVSEE